MTTLTATAAMTIADLYIERAAGETTSAMLTDGRHILDISRNDDGTYHLYTNLGEISNVAGARMVIAPPARTPTKTIAYDRETRDYRMELDGEFVGYAACYHAAEVELDRLAYEQLDRAGVEPEMMQSATALDGGSSPDEIAAEYAESLPIANFRPTIAGPLWDQGYTSPNLPNSARNFRFTVDVCPTCQRLLNHSIYANAAGAWLAYDWCLECDRGRLTGQSCSGMQFICNRPATQHIYSNATGMMHLCDEHAAEWQSYGPDDQPDTDPGHNLVTPDPAECPDVSAPQPCEDLPTYFILPTGDTAQSIILCVNGVSRVVSAQGVAEALDLASVHQVTR